jgi:hypothetical protein
VATQAHSPLGANMGPAENAKGMDMEAGTCEAPASAIQPPSADTMLPARAKPVPYDSEGLVLLGIPLEN